MVSGLFYTNCLRGSVTSLCEFLPSLQYRQRPSLRSWVCVYLCVYMRECVYTHVSMCVIVIIIPQSSAPARPWQCHSLITSAQAGGQCPACSLEVCRTAECTLLTLCARTYTQHPSCSLYWVPSMYTINNTVPSMQSWVNTEFTAQKHNTMGCHHHNATTDQHRVCPAHHHDHLHQQQCPACHHRLPCPAPAAG